MVHIGSTIYQDGIVEADLPLVLRSCLDRHRNNVTDFAQRLRMAGMSDNQINVGVTMIMDSYKSELQHAMKSLQEQVDA